MTNKISELHKRIETCDKCPDIIIITEIKPKNNRFKCTLPELQLQGFTSHYTNLENNTGRGIAIYTKNDLEVREIQWAKGYEEEIALSIKLKAGDRLTICAVYRSPSSSPENNSNLLELIEEIDQSRSSHLLICGDFNYPTINWATMTAYGENNDPNRFLEKIQGSYWTQHIKDPTRARWTDNPSLLDLVFTNEPNMIDDLVHSSPLGSSDHEILEFKYKCYVFQNKSKKIKYMFDTGDYSKMNELMDIDWNERFRNCSDDVQEQWDIFQEEFQKAEEECIPRKINHYRKVQKISKSATRPENPWKNQEETQGMAKISGDKRGRKV